LIENWLRSIGLDEHIAAFKSERVETEHLPDLTDDDLRELGLTIGERKRFRRALTEHPPTEHAETRPSAAKLAAMVQGERRPLTMMFIDMVNSVGLSEQVGDEDLLDVIRAYRDFCGIAIAKTGGHIARFIGDGILAYFCYPMANENDPQRAVRAGLEIVRGIGTVRTPTAQPLQVRVGIATGSVIVSDLFDGGAVDLRSVSGSTPNLAARLQGFAPPNGVIIADETHARVSHLFACEDLGRREVKGLATGHHCWHVQGEIDPASRVRGSGGAMLPVRGRERELRMLDLHWESVTRGDGRAVLLSGEAGVGKSYLAQRFLDSHAIGADMVVTLAGSELDQDNPFYPIAAYLHAQAAAEPGSAWLDRLAGALCDLQIDREEALALVARIAGLPTDPALLSDLTPEQARERSLEALVETLLATSRDGPTCILVEDLHWLDPSTLELLSRLAARLRETMVLLLLTARPNFDAPWLHGQVVTKLVVGRLRPEDMQAMVRDLLGTLAIPAALMARIIERTDGIPLFLQEILRSVQMAALGRPNLAGDYIGETEIPASLQESLMARLDRAGPAKIVAQAASAIGRTVSRRVLAGIVDMDETELERCLTALVEGGILVCERNGADSITLVFSHALVRDIAYDSLLRNRRRVLHERIAAALEALEPDVAQSQPATMALHLSEAGQMRRAAGFWLEAGRQSLGTSALMEATRLLRRGLAALETAAPGPDVTTLQLELLGLLGPALMALHGPGAAETQKHYERSYALCQTMPEEPSHFPLYWGWWRVAEDFHAMGARSAWLLSRAEARRDPGFLLQAHHCNWASHYHTGHFDRCCEHIEAGLKIYGQDDWRHHAPLYGNHDARACAHGELALVHWMQGRPSTAAFYHRQSLDWAVELSHLGSLIHSMDFALTFHVMRRRHADVFEAARELAAFTSQHALKDHAAKGQIYRGWTIATREDPGIGLRILQDGFAMQKDIGTSEDFPIYVCLLAEALMAAGQPERAVDELLRARMQFDEIGLRVWLPEVLRTTAEAMLAADAQAGEPAGSLLEDARRIAEEQGVPMLGLRIAATQARLLIRQDAIDAAAQILSPALGKIESQDGGTDVVAARALMVELRERLKGTGPGQNGPAARLDRKP
jgi:class 3 adenylate cyclase/predicted ATPase